MKKLLLLIGLILLVTLLTYHFTHRPGTKDCGLDPQTVCKTVYAHPEIFKIKQ